jgi:flagellar biosynthetic protein FlhB
MAEDSGQDKSEEPTEKRLRDARKKGQIPRSRELNTFMVLITGSVMMLFLGQRMGEGLLKIMTQQFQLKREVIFDKASPVIYFEQVMLDGLWLIFPLVLPLVIVALFTPIMMGGWNFTLEAMAPKFSKMNPLSGLKRMFGIQGLIELLKSIIKITLVFLVAGMLFDMNFADFMGLSDLDVNQSVAKAVHMVGMSALLLSASLLLVVAIDVPYQIWNVKRQLMMTKQEIKDESKEQEGNPEVKGQIRRKQMEMSQRRMMDEVPKADVVVTNPNHFAVALKYDPQGAGAPVVVAKGIDFIAAQIRNIAVSSGVTLVAAPPLARALYYSTDLEQEIPRGLYVAVAQVLAYVFQLKQASENGWERPKPPVNLDVPEQFRQY